MLYCGPIEIMSQSGTTLQPVTYCGRGMGHTQAQYNPALRGSFYGFSTSNLTSLFLVHLIKTWIANVCLVWSLLPIVGLNQPFKPNNTHTHTQKENQYQQENGHSVFFIWREEYSQLCHSFHKWTCVTKIRLLKREQTSFPGIPETVRAMWSNPTQGSNVKMNWCCDTIK